MLFLSQNYYKYSKSQFEKMASSTDTFLGYMFAKNRHINLKFIMLYVQVYFYIILYGFLKIWKILDLGKSYIKISVFPFWGVKKNVFWKIRDSSLKELLILRHLVLFVCILLLISIFGDFSNIYPFSTKNGMTLGHLNRHISKKN